MNTCQFCSNKLKKAKSVRLSSGEVICSTCKSTAKKDLSLKMFDQFKYSIDELYRMYSEKGIDLKKISAAKKLFAEEISKNVTTFSKKIHILGGHNLLGIPTSTVINQLEDARVYFEGNSTTFFYLTSLEFEGAKYRKEKIQTTKETINTDIDEKTKKNGKTGKVVTGAVIGSLFTPVIGTAIGAYAGSKGKDKKRKKTKKSVTNNNKVSESTKKIEENSVCTIRLTRLSDQKNIVITVESKSADYYELLGIETKHEENIQQSLPKDTDELIKKLKEIKELLDLGVITEEEFENLKQEYIKQK